MVNAGFFGPLTRGPRARCASGGFTYLTVLFIVAIITGGLALVGEVWETSAHREKEAELLHIGGQYRRAIGRYYEATPGLAKTYPKTLEQLVKDDRFPTAQRHLRRLYPDPMTGTNEWGIVKAPDGGIMGVYSLSKTPVLKTANFKAQDATLTGASVYSDWRFFYTPQAATAGVQAPKPAAR